MSGHRRELLRISEDELEEFRRANPGIEGRPVYFCVTRHNDIIIWPRTGVQKKHWNISFEEEACESL